MLLPSLLTADLECPKGFKGLNLGLRSVFSIPLHSGSEVARDREIKSIFINHVSSISYERFLLLVCGQELTKRAVFRSFFDISGRKLSDNYFKFLGPGKHRLSALSGNVGLSILLVVILHFLLVAD